MDKLFRSKKGDEADNLVFGQKFWFYFFSLVLIGVLIFAFVGITNAYIQSFVPVSEDLQTDLLIARVTNMCFVYEEPQTQIKRANILDESKLTQQKLEHCFTSMGLQPNIRIEVKLMEGETYTEIVNLRLGEGAIDTTHHRYTLLHTQNGELLPALLYVTV